MNTEGPGNELNLSKFGVVQYLLKYQILGILTLTYFDRYPQQTGGNPRFPAASG